VARHRSPGDHGPSAQPAQASPASAGPGGSHRLPSAPSPSGAAVKRRGLRRPVVALAAVLTCVAGALLVATAADAVTAPPRLMFSLKSNHSAPTVLKGAALTRPVFVFVQPGPTAVQSVVFTLDPGTPKAIRAQRSAPFDFGAVSGLATGKHQMTAAVTYVGGRLTQLAATFTVTTSVPTPPTTTTPAPPTTTPPTTAPPTTTPTTPAGATCTNPVWTASGNDDMKQFNGYFVHNNVWNPPSGGSQKISVCSEKSWFVEAKNFPNSNFEVFSYPNVHRDLPNYPNGVAVSSFSTIKSTFAGVPQAKGNFNVAYDIWLNGVGNGNGSTELMIWTETRPQTLEPLGSDQGDFTINGVAYDVYRYTSGGVNVVSYKARSTVRSGTFDLKQIIGDGVSRGFVPANPRLSSVDYGIEYRFTDGTARFDVSDFSLTTS
jgi:hypothetical protein